MCGFSSGINQCRNIQFLLYMVLVWNPVYLLNLFSLRSAPFQVSPLQPLPEFTSYLQLHVAGREKLIAFKDHSPTTSVLLKVKVHDPKNTVLNAVLVFTSEPVDIDMMPWVNSHQDVKDLICGF